MQITILPLLNIKINVTLQTGIKVHVSQLSKRHNSKAVVISNGTSAHDVIKMVARKLHMDQKETNRMCLVVELYIPDSRNGRFPAL